MGKKSLITWQNCEFKMDIYVILFISLFFGYGESLKSLAKMKKMLKNSGHSGKNIFDVQISQLREFMHAHWARFAKKLQLQKIHYIAIF